MPNHIDIVYIDMDGVLVDFDGWAASQPGLTDENVWEYAIQVPHFFDTLEPLTEAGFLLTYLQSLHVPLSILTALPRRKILPGAEQDKRNWIHRMIGPTMPVIVVERAELKQEFAGPGRILIDDSELNIPQWRNRGGVGFLYRNFLTLYDEMERFRHARN